MEQGDAGGQAGRGAAAGGRNNPQSLIVVGNRGLALGLGAVRHREERGVRRAGRADVGGGRPERRDNLIHIRSASRTALPLVANQRERRFAACVRTVELGEYRDNREVRRQGPFALVGPPGRVIENARQHPAGLIGLFCAATRSRRHAAGPERCSARIQRADGNRPAIDTERPCVAASARRTSEGPDRSAHQLSTGRRLRLPGVTRPGVLPDFGLWHRLPLRGHREENGEGCLDHQPQGRCG